MAEQVPETPEGQALQRQLGPKRWARVVAKATAYAQIVDAVVAHEAATSDSWRQSLAVVSPDTPWPTFVNWLRRYNRGTGPTWERVLDQRTPPDQTVAAHIRDAAVSLRRVNRGLSVQAAHGHLQALFGAAGKVSDAWLRRVWAAAGLANVAGTTGPASSPKSGSGTGAVVATATAKATAPTAATQLEEVQTFHGGAGLALLAAAEAEVQCASALAKALQEAGTARAKASATANLDDDAADRDELGRFTPEYNARRRGTTPAGQADSRWDSDAAKAAQRPLSTLSVLHIAPETLATKLLAMGATPLLINGRGFDGLVGSSGAWLGVLGGVAYMPATLDKALAELGLLDIDDVIWRAYAATWHQVSKRWCGPETNWLQTAVYIDGTADPYWTHKFAQSGKVSRVGRVMPCLSRIAINSGAGVPLLVETHTGAISLRKRLLPMLTELDAAIGPDAGVGRLTVVDSEAGTAAMMWAMHSQTQMIFITVLKGQVLAGCDVSQEQPWQPYRERDELREVDVRVYGTGVPKEGLLFRGVQMRRNDSRHPHTTLFATTAHIDDLPTRGVADHYLGRWPRQEQFFRNARNGGGLNRSHGFGGGEVQHVALVAKLEKAGHAAELAQDRHTQAVEKRTAMAADLADLTPQARRPALALADKRVRDTDKKSAQRQAELAELKTMPEQIHERDTGRDSTMTCLKLMVTTLLEFVLKEYFGGAGMEWRTFIEQLVLLPVTMRTNDVRCLYQIHTNPRNPALMISVAAAVAEINRRGLRRGKLRLEFEVLPGVIPGPGP